MINAAIIYSGFGNVPDRVEFYDAAQSDQFSAILEGKMWDCAKDILSYLPDTVKVRGFAGDPIVELFGDGIMIEAHVIYRKMSGGLLSVSAYKEHSFTQLWEKRIKF